MAVGTPSFTKEEVVFKSIVGKKEFFLIFTIFTVSYVL